MKWLKYIWLFFLSCKKDDFVTYTIKKGNHRCDKITGLTERATISFWVKFTESCKYTIEGDNKYDINKLYGLSDNSGHHDNSARVGWRYMNDSIQMFSYCYVKGIRMEKYLYTANIGQVVFCSVTIEEEAYHIEIADKWDLVERDKSYKIGYVYELLPYFGGQSVPDHDVKILIKKCDY